MRKKASKLLSILTIAALLLMNGSWAPASGHPQVGSPPGELNLSSKNSFSVPQEDKSQIPGDRKKLSTDLLSLVDEVYMPSGQSGPELRLQMEGFGQFGQDPQIMNGGDTGAGQVHVYIYLNPPARTKVVEPYVNVQSRDEKNHYVVGWVDVNDLDSLAALKDVRSVRTVIPPVVRTGSVNSEGDALLNADDVRSVMGVDGTGIKVGVISDGVDSISDSVYSGDLPAGVTVLSAGSGDEGTAMLEIIHDLAPGAQLYFHDCGDNTAQFNQAIDALAAAGCNIICDDIGWITEPFFEDGVVAGHVASVIAGNDVLYVSAAGNDARSHYQGMFTPYGGTSIHDFSGGGDPDFTDLYINIPAGEKVYIILEWDDQWGSSGNDYDLYLVNYSNGDELSSSELPQEGSDDPIEAIAYTNNTGSAVNAAILVSKYAGAARTLEVYIYGDNYSNNITPEDSIFGHPAVPGVIAAGAVNYSSPGQIAGYSSRGPVTLFDGSTRGKPEVCGIDGVAVTGAGGFGQDVGGTVRFYGTSAAAPHVAAVAALAMEKSPALSASELAGIINGSSTDLGAPGFDYLFGNGLADAFNIVDNTPGPGQLGFAGAGQSVGEEGGSASITVTRTGGTYGAVTVNYATSNGSAADGSDYTAAGGTLSFGDGETAQSFTVPILEDSVDEDSETVNLTLSNPGGGATLGGQSTAVITITDNDTTSGGGGGGGGGFTALPGGEPVDDGGGTLNESGVTITVPAGALDEEIRVQVEEATSVTGMTLPKGGRLVSRVVEIVKDKSGNFEKPVTITMAFDRSEVDPDQYTVSIYWYDESSGRWVELENVMVDMAGGTVSGDVNHFTKFAVIAVKKPVPIPSLPPVLRDDAALADISGHWAEANIKSLAATGAVSGYPDGTFKPDDKITRAEFAAMLVGAFQLKTQGGKVFKDTAGHWAEDFISTAAALEIVNGYPEGNFGPDDFITREQMAVMTVKAAGLTGTSRELIFRDTKDISDWALEAVAMATGSGIMRGYPDSTVNPGGSATRAEAVTVIMNALNKK